MDPVEIFYYIDEFCKIYSEESKRYFIKRENIKNAGRKPAMAMSEVITIKVMYHTSGFKTFKDFYMKNNAELKDYFPNLVSYSRLVELNIQNAVPLLIFAKIFCTKEADEVSFIDSTKLSVCHIKRASSNKVFKGIAAKSKTSVGWFYGLKLHLMIKASGEIIDFTVTSGNVADNNPHLIRKLTRVIRGKLFGDRGYIINQELVAELYKRDLQLISKARKNMQPRPISPDDSRVLTKRGIIDSVIGILKQSLDLEHSRHRNPFAFLAHISSTLIAYFFRSNKPSIIAGPAALIN